MIGNGASQQAQPEQQEQRDITTEDIHRQQRANLALRALDLEAENVMLQQENQKLKAEIEELRTPAGSVNKTRNHPVPSISDA